MQREREGISQEELKKYIYLEMILSDFVQINNFCKREYKLCRRRNRLTRIFVDLISKFQLIISCYF